MEQDLLAEKKVVIEQRFEELTKNKLEIEQELSRLQGEHRLVLELMSSDLVKPRRIKKVSEQNATN